MITGGHNQIPLDITDADIWKESVKWIYTHN